MSDSRKQQDTPATDVNLELEMQELEAMEAPGWATVSGVSVGVSIVSVAWSVT
ncbi:daptide-type RiPP [Nocardiopsis sp. FIRDI 009]|uniref:daptide-type RiPP n=1 Tax=Nocardiopsis sp. FIRDI 009 TaxID=714197 RepID=UPI0018E533FF|nr:daptide-type RiPP [Nocardiopsis sp. FIRDI 009]